MDGKNVCARYGHKQKNGKHLMKVAPTSLPVRDANNPEDKVRAACVTVGL